MPFELPRRSYVLPAGADVVSLVSSLGAQLDGTGLAVTDDRPTKLDVTFLDTADRRLRAAGHELRLECPVGGGDAGRLVLHQHPGDERASRRHNPPPVGDVPAARRYLVDDLPASALRDRVAPIIAVRALLPLARARLEVHPLRILNRDEKTVARLALTTATVLSGADRAAAPPARQAADPPGTDDAAWSPQRTATAVRAATGGTRSPAADANAGPPGHALPGPVALAPRAELTGVLGYDKPFGRLENLLGQELGWAGTTMGWTDEAVAALGGDPAGIPTKPRTWLSPGQRTDEAAVAVLSGLADVVEANLPGTLDDLDTEFLHDLRVAVRRSRSVLRELRRAFPPEALAQQRHALRWIQEITGPTRDLDVQLLDEEGLLAPVADGGHDTLGPVRELLARQRAAAFRTLRRRLRSRTFARRWVDYRSSLSTVAADAAIARHADSPAAGRAVGAAASAPADEQLLSSATDDERPVPARPIAGGEPAGAMRPAPDDDASEAMRPRDGGRPDAARPIAQVAGRRIRRVYGRMLAMGGAIDDTSPAEALHELRKRGKELRYLLELFGGLWPADAVRPMVRRLKGLQDVLGAHQDREVQAVQLRSLAGELASVDGGPEALLALGVVVDRLGDAQRASRAAFAERFARFADADQRRLVDDTFRRPR